MPPVSGCRPIAPHACSHPSITLAFGLATEVQAPRQVPRNPPAQSPGTQPLGLLPSDWAKSQGTPHRYIYFYFFFTISGLSLLDLGSGSHSLRRSEFKGLAPQLPHAGNSHGAPRSVATPSRHSSCRSFSSASPGNALPRREKRARPLPSRPLRSLAASAKAAPNRRLARSPWRRWTRRGLGRHGRLQPRGAGGQLARGGVPGGGDRGAGPFSPPPLLPRSLPASSPDGVPPPLILAKPQVVCAG